MTPTLTAHPTPAPCQLLQGGREYFAALVQALDSARRGVQLETYIFDLHGAGSTVAEALMRAARRGVAVQVLVDGVGTPKIDAECLERMQQAGVQWQVFSPVRGRWGQLLLLLSPTRWRRLHRKLCVVDGQLLFCGGINVLDDWYDPNHGPLQAPRFDFMLQITGPVARQAADAMAQLWWRVQAGDSVRQRHLGQAWEALREAGHWGRATDHGLAPDVAPEAAHASLLLRDNLRHRNSIERAYRKAIGQARREVLISNAYFLPGNRLRRALVQAARRGVKVSLLLQGRYEYFMQYHAARSVYQALLQAGIEIHEYESSFLHAKVAVVDGHWATVGSSNLDPLSLLLAREANVVVMDVRFAQALRGRLLAAIQGHGRQVRVEEYSRRPWRERALNALAYGLMRLALFLTGHRY